VLRIISQRTLDTGEEMLPCFIHWNKARDRVKWIDLMQILKNTGGDWSERNSSANCA